MADREKERQRFHPSEFIIEEMEERNWTLVDISHYSQIDADRIQNVINGGRISRSIAKGLSQAFGTSAAMWMKLQKSYDQGTITHA